MSLVLGTKLPGAALFVSVNTVKTRTRGIFRKLAASSRHEAVEWARADGLRE